MPVTASELRRAASSRRNAKTEAFGAGEGVNDSVQKRSIAMGEIRLVEVFFDYI